MDEKMTKKETIKDNEEMTEKSFKDKLLNILLYGLAITMQICLVCLPLIFTILTGIHMSISAWVIIIELIIIVLALRK